MSAVPESVQNNSVWWVGQDGNVWSKSSAFTGVKNLGKPTLINEGGAWLEDGSSPLGSQIDDPLAPKSLAQAPGGGTYDYGAEVAKRQANEAARNNTQKAIDSLGTELDVGYGNIDNEANAIRSKYDAETTRNKADYEGNVVTNNENLLRDKQNSMLSGAQGLRGLRSVMGSINALSGDGSKLANRAVMNSVNSDIGKASETFGTNAKALDGAWDKYGEDDENRRAELETSRKNQRTALEGRVASKKQSFYQKMADLFGDIGDAGNATDWMNRAGDLNNEIANKTAVAATPFSAKTAAFTPGTLADYISGAGDMTASVGPANGAPAGMSSLLVGRRRDDRNKVV